MEKQFQADAPINYYREPTVFDSNFLYFSVLIGMLIFGGVLFAVFNPERIEVLTLLSLLAILTVVVIGLPMLIYVIRGNVDYKSLFRLYPVDIEELALVAGLAFLGYPAITGINIIWHSLISLIGTPIIPPLPPLTNLTEFLVALIVIGVFPSVFEELMFRGIMLRGYERLGKFAAVAITGILFGFLHMSFANFPALIILGIVLGYVVYRSDSVYTGMLYHFIHNSIAVTFMFLAGLAQPLVEDPVLSQQLMSDEQMILLGRIIWIVLAALSAGGFIACLKAYNRKTKNKKSRHIVETIKPKRLFIQMLPALGGGFIIVMMLVYEVFVMITSG